MPFTNRSVTSASPRARSTANRFRGYREPRPPPGPEVRPFAFTIFPYATLCRSGAGGRLAPPPPGHRTWAHAGGGELGGAANAHRGQAALAAGSGCRACLLRIARLRARRHERGLLQTGSAGIGSPAHRPGLRSDPSRSRSSPTRRSADLGLVVDSRHRRQRIGLGLMQAAESWAALRMLTEVRLRSRLDRGAAHAFYESLGYERVATSAVYCKPVPRVSGAPPTARA